MNEVKHSNYQDRLALERQFEKVKKKPLEEVLQLFLNAKVEEIRAQAQEFTATLGKRQKEIEATMETITAAAKSIDVIRALQLESDDLQKAVRELKLTQTNLSPQLDKIAEQLSTQEKQKKKVQQEVDSRIDSLKGGK